MHLIYYRVGEDPNVMLPQYVCQDGYFVTHILGDVEVPEEAQVKEFLPPYKNHHVLDVRDPQIIGPQIEPAMGPPQQYQRKLAFDRINDVLIKAHDDFARIFGRKYDPFLEEFMTDDAEVVIFGQGAHMNTAKAVAARLRNLERRLALSGCVLSVHSLHRRFSTECLNLKLSGFSTTQLTLESPAVAECCSVNCVQLSMM